MFDEHTLEVLEKVKKDCRKRKTCSGCRAFIKPPNATYGRCLLGKAPYDWQIEQIKRAGRHPAQHD